MNTITVENTNYQFEDVPGKGKCLVPVKESPVCFQVGDLVTSKYFNNNPIYVVAEIGNKDDYRKVYGIVLLSNRDGNKPVPYVCGGSFAPENSLEELSKKLREGTFPSYVKFIKVGHGVTPNLT